MGAVMKMIIHFIHLLFLLTSYLDKTIYTQSCTMSRGKTCGSVIIPALQLVGNWGALTIKKLWEDKEELVTTSSWHKKMEDDIFKVYLYSEDNFYSHCVKKISYHCLQTPPGNTCIDQHLILLSLSFTLVAFSWVILLPGRLLPLQFPTQKMISKSVGKCSYFLQFLRSTYSIFNGQPIQFS